MDPLDEGIGATESMELGTGVHELLTWQTHWKLEKREGDGATYPGGIEAFKRDVDPFETIEFDGNLLTTIGALCLWDRLTDGTPTYGPFDNANAYLGVGDSDTAAAVGQTDLLAGPNKLRKAMNATYPIVASPVVTFQSDFTAGEAIWTWNEVATFNGAAALQMLNRKVAALGVKGASTWTLTETITLS